MRKRTTRIVATFAAAVMLVGMIPLTAVTTSAETDMSMDDFDDLLSKYSVDDDVPDYEDYIAQYSIKYPSTDVVITAEDCSRYLEDDAEAEVRIESDYEGMEGDSVYTSENSLVEYDVTIKEEGFYNILVSYYPVEGKSSDMRGAYILTVLSRIRKCPQFTSSVSGNLMWKAQ